MAISGDYPNPVTVNGFACHNCTEVDQAKKHIDPAHPQDGPFGINAKARSSHGPAVTFGGTLQDQSPSQGTSPPSGPGALLSLTV